MSTSRDTMAALLARNYALTHERIVTAADAMDAATFSKNAGPAVHSVAAVARRCDRDDR